jgi:hypothetical protein
MKLPTHPGMAQPGLAVKCLTAAALLALLSACSAAPASQPSAANPTLVPPASSGASGSSAAPGGSVAAISPAPSGPATMSLTGTGDPGVSGAWSGSLIRCGEPRVTGPEIDAFAVVPDKATTVLLTVTADSINVSLRAGAGSTYTERDFTGSGVSGFDAAHGATIDSDLTQVADGSNPGKLDAMKHLSGSIDCAGQQSGSATVTLAGSIPQGAITGGLDPVRVECDVDPTYGNYVSVHGILTAGTTKTFAIIVVRAADSPYQSSLFMVPATGAQQSLLAPLHAPSTLSATGAHVDADFSQAAGAGSSAAPNVIHLVGDLTCGATFNN